MGGYYIIGSKRDFMGDMGFRSRLSDSEIMKPASHLQSRYSLYRGRSTIADGVVDDCNADFRRYAKIIQGVGVGVIRWLNCK